MKKFFDHFTGYIQTDIFLTAARQKGWTVEVFFTEEYAFAEISKGDLKYRVSRDSLSFNSNVSTKISSNKYLSNLILKRYIPEFVTQANVYQIDELNDEVILELLNKHLKLVVKPVSENNGVGVTTSLTSLEAVKRAIEKISLLGAKKILIENHVEVGNEYRVIVWKGKAIDVLNRIPAYVTGDGTSTIQSLIEQKNQLRYDLFENVFEPIVIDPDLSILLQSKNLTLSSVLPDKEHLTVKTTCNLSTGGEVKRIELSAVHPHYLEIFQKMYEATWMNYCGLDLITPDITQTPVIGKTVINELNGAPGLTLAFYDDLATNRPFYGMFQTLEKMENDPVRVFTP